MEKVIIFDLGGVLIDWNPRYLYQSYFETPEAVEYFLTHICTMDWNEEQDGGRSIDEANNLLIAKYPEYKQEILAYYNEWTTMLNGPIQDTVDLLQSIKAQNRNVYALTNWSAETFPIAQERYPFLEWFDGILVSGQEGLKKPDEKIYKLLLDRYQLKAEDCLFIDDNLRNVKAAQNLGITSIHYAGPQQLKEELKKHNINS